ncbi:TlpA disulfide reductase family protein [Mucilaginibacter sp.]|uniref:TlpA disulfide reductase family protein n=1 Tax=Mucilaginibacter sp. TaxID=1882438 RepID=UPI0026240B35|nr:TlpA disulfide reductase family protein [Mucilaginibacter sp.]MDB4925987.1 AhpC/TSA family protein [Mucilaginibacter sp.]
MKKIILSILMFGCSLIASAQEKPEEKIIFKGSADPVYNGSVIVIYNKSIGVLDSAKVENGNFAFTVPYKEPSRYMFYSKYEAKKKGGYAPYGILITSPETVNIKADMETLANSAIGNAPENDLYMAFVKAGNAGRQKVMDQFDEKYGAGFMKKLTQKDPKYPEAIKYYQELNNANNVLETARLETFIKNNPDSFTAIYLLNGIFANMQTEKAQSLYNLVPAKYKNTSYGKTIMQRIEAAKITAIGKIAPDFEQPDTANKMVKLSGFRGQYLLLDFWASWCGPCRQENPNVVKAYQKYHDKGFTVLGVSLDQPGKKEAWLNAIHHDQLTWTQVSDLQFWNNTVAKLYGIQAIPQNFLLDKEGKIVAVNIRGDDLTNKLAELLDKK